LEFVFNQCFRDFQLEVNENHLLIPALTKVVANFLGRDQQENQLVVRAELWEEIAHRLSALQVDVVYLPSGSILLNDKPLGTVLVAVLDGEEIVRDDVRDFVVVFVRDKVLFFKAVPMEASVILSVLNQKVVHLEVGLDFVREVWRAEFEHRVHFLVVFAAKLDQFGLVFPLELAD